ncbi:MAG: phosphatase PAP2 family protein, partial [Chitinophagaceae bacterium]
AGHLAIGFKKISPGGHWMNIASIASKKAKLGFNQSILMHTMVSAALMDAFISCWDEKYRSHRVRPETFINKYISLKWQPLLQTPPFPEYPSGHSVISTAAAEVLTYFLGDSFAYIDDSELMFEIPSRSFVSFRHAAEEAAISRLYGGIHFRDAILHGQTEGKNVGIFIVNKLRSAGIKPFRN